MFPDPTEKNFFIEFLALYRLFILIVSISKEASPKFKKAGGPTRKSS
jgi:hypothetical protein